MKALELTRTIFQEVKNSLRDIKSNEYIDLSDSTKSQFKKQLQRDGLVIIPDYYSAQKCDKIHERLDELFADEAKLWKDAVGSDNRIHFANEYDKDIEEFYSDPFITSILTSYQKTSKFNGFTLANKVIPKPGNKGSGQGWHRDYVKRSQTKSFMYITDVTEENGPFQYILGTHRLSSVLDVQAKLNSKFDQYKYTPELIDDLLEKSNYQLKTVTAAKGTLILADTRGLHRGKPIESGARYALTNYYWYKSSIPVHIKNMRAGGEISD